LEGDALLLLTLLTWSLLQFDRLIVIIESSHLILVQLTHCQRLLSVLIGWDLSIYWRWRLGLVVHRLEALKVIIVVVSSHHILIDGLHLALPDQHIVVVHLLLLLGKESPHGHIKVILFGIYFLLLQIIQPSEPL